MKSYKIKELVLRKLTKLNEEQVELFRKMLEDIDLKNAAENNEKISY